MKIAICAVALLGLAACQKPEANIPAGRVVHITTAPDGTKLWGVKTNGRVVYFASSGTATTESCGKSCTRDEQVPTAPRPSDDAPVASPVVNSY